MLVQKINIKIAEFAAANIAATFVLFGKYL